VLRSLIFVVILASPAAAEQPKLAMTALQCNPAAICSGTGQQLRLDLQDQLEAAVLGVVRGHLGIITPDAVMRELTLGGKSRAEAERTCLEASCAVDIGGALGAEFIMQSMIYELGNRKKLTLKVWRVEDNTSASSGSIVADTLAALGAELPRLARDTCAPLITRARRQTSDVMSFDDDKGGAPQIASAAVTTALGGLVAAGKPAAARIAVRGPKGGEFSLRIGDTRDSLALGTYTWSAKAVGYMAASGSLEVTPDGVTPIVIALKKLASLAVVGSPSGGKVDVTGPSGPLKPVGLGTTLRDLAPGAYSLKISKSGYEPQTHNLSLDPGAVQRVEIELIRLGGLKVSGSPAGAKVSVSAEKLGFSNEGGLPWSAQGLQSGIYTVEIRRSGYASARRKVTVKAGELASVSVGLNTGSGWDEKSAAGGGALTSRWGYKMVRIPAGTYTMGSNSGGSDEKPVHQVRLTRAFAMGATEVTQAQYQALMGNNPSHFKGDNRPVEQVSWVDAARFANAASARDNLQRCYDISGSNVRWSRGLACTGYRLPTEAEWEVAARAGKDYKYAGGDDLSAVAWTEENSSGRTHDVATKRPNDFGLYDMTGNVWEWVWDGYGPYESGTIVDPTGVKSPSDRVLRGGSWYDTAADARLAIRFRYGPGLRDNGLGFRLSRTVP
jgi:formylglycine-generating enzyme required for sulfatase activity